MKENKLADMSMSFSVQIINLFLYFFMLQRNPALNRRRDLNPRQNITKTATQFENKSNYAAVF